MFIIAILFKMGLIYDKLFSILIGIGFAILVIYFMKVSFDMLFRDDHNYDEYKFIHSDYYLNKNNDNLNQENNDIPLHMQKDKPPNCSTQ